MKRIIAIILLFLSSTFSFGQSAEFEVPGASIFARGGFGTSWIILPKVFLTDPNDNTNNWEILPAKNSFTGYIGLQGVISIGNFWRFAPEIDYNYISGEIRVDELKNEEDAQKLQTYHRIAVPLNFGVLSSDNFWLSFGPIVYFTLADNKGFDNAVYQLTTHANINSDVPIGLSFRLAAYVSLNSNSYIDVKFESDLGSSFKYVDDQYQMRFSMQSITVGYGYRIKSFK